MSNLLTISNRRHDKASFKAVVGCIYRGVLADAFMPTLSVVVCALSQRVFATSKVTILPPKVLYHFDPIVRTNP
ncbi:hypothetical protein [Shewanella sp.]|uniref:hypothetical protein n=1 Tax=Shewanella sp. TaxID=50422 RepID=UPI0025886788|nr:hypothetical protein [Shewanella sp.]MCJ8305346.1 hypothetical protein [Shewanella sp.]